MGRKTKRSRGRLRLTNVLAAGDAGLACGAYGVLARVFWLPPTQPAAAVVLQLSKET